MCCVVEVEVEVEVVGVCGKHCHAQSLSEAAHVLNDNAGV